jgi:hypothetical protein
MLKGALVKPCAVIGIPHSYADIFSASGLEGENNQLIANITAANTGTKIIKVIIDI